MILTKKTEPNPNHEGVPLYSQNLLDCMNNITPSGFGLSMDIFYNNVIPL